jgi:hypothetical protein
MSEFDGKEVELSQVISAGIDRKLDQVYWSLVCRVAKINTDPYYSVDLEPLTQVLNDAGEPVTLSIIPCVPLAIMKSGPFVFSIPTAVGVTGTARIYSRSISQWLASGSKDAEPEGKRRGARTDAIFLPDIQPFTARPEAEQSERIVIGLDSGRVGITIDPSGTVYAGAEATANGSVALSTPVTADFQAVANDLFQLQTVIAGLGGSFNPTFTSPTSNATAKLKAE